MNILIQLIFYMIVVIMITDTDIKLCILDF